MPTPPPGWYADPAGSTQYRWWDGQDWTDALSPTAQARPPLAAHPAEAPETEAPETEAPETEAPEVETLTLGNHRPRRGLAPLAVVVVVALVAVSLGGVLLRDPADSDATGAPAPAGSTAPAPGPSAAEISPRDQTQGSTPPGWLDTTTGEARIGDATLTLPGDPYQLTDGPAHPTEVFDAGFTANASVHAAAGNAPSWYSTVALLHVPADQVGVARSTAARRAGTAVLGYLFGGVDIEPRNLSWTPTAVSGREATRITGQIEYDVTDLASSHDDITLVVVELSDGSYAAALSSVPDDAPELVRSLAADAVASFSVR